MKQLKPLMLQQKRQFSPSWKSLWKLHFDKKIMIICSAFDHLWILIYSMESVMSQFIASILPFKKKIIATHSLSWSHFATNHRGREQTTGAHQFYSPEGVRWSEALKICWAPAGTQLSIPLGHSDMRRADLKHGQPWETLQLTSELHHRERRGRVYSEKRNEGR